MFFCLETHGIRSIFETPDKPLTVNFHMAGFVDDSTGQVNHFISDTPSSLDQLICTIEKNAQLWNMFYYTFMAAN